MTPSLGSIAINLPSLLETRMLVQCNSGGGKSYCLRRFLEQTARGVQQIVIDPEGEFSSLREKFDYIICAPHGADAVATPHTAAALARAVWESGTSAIVDIYELKAHERTLFVRRFCEALINAPKRIWHPALVIIDEVHVFAPQVGSAESSGAVIDLATRGRKRGLALVGATQRLSKLNKDVAAELLNKLVGRTSLDVDVVRAADELGMSRQNATEVLRNLDPGEFFVYGPALSRTVERTRIGLVITTHPQPGHRLLTEPPPPSAAVLKKLGQLEGIQREAVEEVNTVEALKHDTARLRRELAAAEKRAAQVGVPEAEVEKRIKAALGSRPPASVPNREHEESLAAIHAITTRALGGTSKQLRAKAAHPKPKITFAPLTPALKLTPTGDSVPLRAGARRILAELVTRSPAGYSKAQVGALTRFSHKGGTFGAYFGDLKRAGYIEERDGLIYATDAGIASVGGVKQAPKTHDEVMAMWRRALRSGAHRMLEIIVTCGASGTTKDALAAEIDMTMSGGTFGAYLGDLRRNGLITDKGGLLVANDILYPERT